MNRYTIDLTITAEPTNEQVIQLKALHLTGKQVHDLVGISVEGIVIEPEPPVLVVPKQKNSYKKFKKIVRSKPAVKPPEGFSNKEMENI